jgi:hypothetical protein
LANVYNDGMLKTVLDENTDCYVYNDA